MRSLSLLAFCSILLLPSSLFAYTTHRTTLGPLTMYFGTNERLAKQEKITKLDEPLTLTATLENKGDTPFAINLTFRTIETIEFKAVDYKAKSANGNNVETWSFGEKMVTHSNILPAK